MHHITNPESAHYAACKLKGQIHLNEPSTSSEIPPDTQSLPVSPPLGYSGVWPPPINMGPVAASVLTVPFKYLYMRLSGNVADLREGTVSISSTGLTLEGKAMPRAEIATTIMVACLILSWLVTVIAYYVMRYGFLQYFNLTVPWQDVTQVVLVPKKYRVGLAYTAPNYKGVLKKYCFCMTLTPADYTSFSEAARELAPQVTAEGKLRSGTSPILLLFLVLLLTLLSIGMYISFTQHPA